jgi:hypothetical protein
MPDSNFNWVTARAACCVDAVFQSIRLGVEADIKIRNEQRPEATPFRVVYESGEFVVFVKTPRTHRILRFQATETGITVTDDQTRQIVVGGRLTLSNDGVCRIKVKDSELEFWQFRRAALESMLFEPVL